MKRYVESYLSNLITGFSVFGIFIYFYFFKDFYFLSSLGIAGFLYILLSLLNKLGSSLPVRELMGFILSLQLLIAPLIAYRNFDNKMSFDMHVPELIYIQFVFLFITAFYIGVVLPINKGNITVLKMRESDPIRNFKIGFLFIFIGLTAHYSTSLIPRSLFFVFYLLSYVRFIGVFYLIFSNYKYKYLVTTGIFLHFSYFIISGGLFYDLIIWGFFLYMVIELRLKSSFISKITVFAIGIGALVFLQSIKGDYREEIQTNNGVSNVEKFIDVAREERKKEVIPGVRPEDSNLEKFVSRLNTGWIVSYVIYHVPKYQPISNGKLLLEDLGAVLLPRFLNPGKKSVGGNENRAKFKKYTGRHLRDSTTMRIGVVADAYINFGFWGGALLMFSFGFLLNLVLSYFKTLSKKDPMINLWVLYIFSFTIRMSDFLVILNSTFKGVILFFVFMFLIHNVISHSKRVITS